LTYQFNQNKFKIINLTSSIHISNYNILGLQEKFHKLLNILSQLTDVNFDIVDVSRELVKEGKIIKISARNGEKSERYIYLVSEK